MVEGGRKVPGASSLGHESLSQGLHPPEVSTPPTNISIFGLGFQYKSFGGGHKDSNHSRHVYIAHMDLSGYCGWKLPSKMRVGF